MDRIIDLINILQKNYSNDIRYFESIVKQETKKSVSLYVENDKIMMYHIITARELGEYKPSDEFKELANAFITYKKPSFSIKDLEQIKTIFIKHHIPLSF